MSYNDYYWQMSEGKDKAKVEAPWHKYICEYYDVTPETALKLGTRSDGRKPSLPGSITCKPVSGMTMEEIWALKPRDTMESVYDFYVEQGAWSAFRQTVRHVELKPMEKNLMSQIASDGMHICEYGCGIAPFSQTLLQSVPSSWNIDVSVTDVDKCEHYVYGQWVLNKIIEERDLKGAKVHAHPAIPHQLPKYDKNIDVFIIFEVLEHVPSPTAVINNIIEQMSPNAMLVENFVKHEEKHLEPGPDLESAIDEREEFYKIVKENFRLLSENPEEQYPNGTRVWMRKS
jgi:2-polyprenyl-3-methyl-5-hydroxy-6-metoxy-1,4-benzoquinol methylase